MAVSYEFLKGVPARLLGYAILFVFQFLALTMWNSHCDSLTLAGLFICLGISILILALCLYERSRRKFHFQNVVICFLVLLSVAVALVSVYWFYKTRPDYNSNKSGNILIAKFIDQEGADPVVQEVIVRSMRKDLREFSAISVKSYNSFISEGDGNETARKCLDDCNGLAVLWGSYSSSPGGSIRFHLDFKNTCLEVWTGVDTRYREIKYQSEGSELEMKKFSQEVVNLLSAFSFFIGENATCSFKEAPKVAIEEAKEFLKVAKLAKGRADELQFGYYFLASHFFRLKNYEEAEQYLNESIIDLPRDLELRTIHAMNLVALNRLEDALGEIKFARALDPQNKRLASFSELINREWSVAAGVNGQEIEPHDPAWPKQNEPYVHHGVPASIGPDLVEPKTPYISGATGQRRPVDLRPSGKWEARSEALKLDPDENLSELQIKSERLCRDLIQKKEWEQSRLACKRALDLNPKNSLLERSVDLSDRILKAGKQLKKHEGP